MVVEWDKSLETGVKEIDEQHKEIFRRINSLFDAHKSGEGAKETERLLNFLGEYVLSHFATEEKFMTADIWYPNAAQHKEAHRKFAAQFVELKTEFLKEGPTAAYIIKINRVVVNWLFEHIHRVDMDFAKYLKK